MFNRDKIRFKIEEALNQYRIYLNKDGGNVEIVDVRDDGIVSLRYTGTCKDCPLSLMTLRGGIERVILNAVSEIKRVELVN